MSEIAETYNAMREESKRRRGTRRERNPQQLAKAGIPFEVRNKGAHVIVKGNDCLIDYWPGTGRWIARNGERGFGVRNLIDHINSKKKFEAGKSSCGSGWMVFDNEACYCVSGPMSEDAACLLAAELNAESK